MAKTFPLAVPKASPGDRVAVLSPSFAAPAVAPAIHEQALTRLTEATGLVPVEYPTTRKLGASPEERAADINSAFADRQIRAILATLGGDDQITVVPHLDSELLAANPKPFVGYSDNTNLHNLLWGLGVRSFYGGSTQVHLGAGPGIDPIHLQSLRAALITGETITLTNPDDSEDHGLDWADPRALREYGQREPNEPWLWAGADRVAAGPTWGGCLEVIDQLALAGRLPAPEQLDGAILLLETSEELPPASWVGRWVRALGEGGLLEPLSGVLLARAPVTSFEKPIASAAKRSDLRRAQQGAVIEQISRYNPGAVICAGVPFGHTRPQWIVPYGGEILLDPAGGKVVGDYR